MNMSEMDRIFCESAIAYLKIVVPNDSKQAARLSREDSPVLRKLDHGLLVAYLVDQEGHFNYVQHRHMEKAGLNEDELHKAGLHNLSAMTQEKLKVKPYGNVFAVFLDGNFEASLLLLDWLWDTGVANTVTNGFVAAFPARDILAYCDASSAQGIVELRQIIARLPENADHPLVRTLYKRRGKTWVPFNDA